MLYSGNPKTTATGIVLLLIGLVSWLFGVGFVELFQAIVSFDLQPILEVALPLLVGTGFLAASDNDVPK
jgi:hypothetical protein